MWSPGVCNEVHVSRPAIQRFHLSQTWGFGAHKLGSVFFPSPPDICMHQFFTSASLQITWTTSHTRTLITVRCKSRKKSTLATALQRGVTQTCVGGRLLRFSADHRLIFPSPESFLPYPAICHCAAALKAFEKARRVFYAARRFSEVRTVNKAEVLLRFALKFHKDMKTVVFKFVFLTLLGCRGHFLALWILLRRNEFSFHVENMSFLTCLSNEVPSYLFPLKHME